ncbi:MAG: GAF domain-containing protein [Anaerolineales bacterium]|nr:GAF domain-containing protein [Anaerolineales bacterium]
MFNYIASTISDEQLQKNVKKITRLVEISGILNSTLKPDLLLQTILDTAAELLECSDVSILLYDERTEKLRFAAATGANREQLEEIPVPLDSSLAGTIFTENRHLVINNVEQDPRHYDEVGEQIQYHVNSLLGVPMRIKDRVTGVIEALNKQGGDFTEFDVSLLLVIASQAAISIQNAQLIQALQKANVELSQADKLKRDLMSIASHELRTPLGNILGYATLLHEEASKKTKPMAESILRASTRLRAVLDDMANMNLLYTGEADLDLVPTTLQAVIEIAEEEVRNTLHDDFQEIHYALPDEPINLYVDLPKLCVVFINLMENAIRFTPPEGEIELTAQEQGEKLVIEISDSGHGIPPEDLEKIFDVFYQKEDHMTRRYGGLGLGLSIARELVELHKGRIWAESEGEGKGSTFHVSFPKIHPTASR